MSGLTIHDYKHILDYYNKPIPKTKQMIKKQAEEIIANKLCRCIKKIDHKYNKKYESRSIGACTKSVINSKGFIRGSFTCKKKSHPRIALFKKTKKNRKQ